MCQALRGIGRTDREGGPNPNLHVHRRLECWRGGGGGGKAITRGS